MTSGTENKSIHWVEGHESKFFMSVTANCFENLLDDLGVMEEGWPSVECVTVFLEQAGAPSDCIGFLEDCNVHARMGKQESRCKTAWSGTYDDGSWCVCVGHSFRPSD
jgi:hypothetical protein